jgi:hypothetical protein
MIRPLNVYFGAGRARDGNQRILAPPMTAPYASAAIRDRFLGALDADDRTLSTELAHGLTCCNNPLPGMTCDQLGLPKGSTYGMAARHVLQLYSVTP